VNIIAANYGSSPRIGDTKEQQRLRVALEAFQRGEITQKKLEQVQNGLVKEVLDEQARAGLDVVSDGQVRWSDAVSRPMGRLKGVSINGLLRYFDTNTYFRQPQVIGAISAKGPILADDLKLAVAMSAKPVVATLLGPLTLSRLSIVKGGDYADWKAVMEALVPVLADEIERLVAAGADAIVLEEPALLKDPKALPALSDALEVIGARKGSVNLWLFPSFGDAGPVYDKLQELPVDGLLLDFTYGKGALAAVASAGTRLALGLGLVDARNTKLESPGRVAAAAGKLLRKVRGPVAGLCPSNGLEYLPRTRAREKLAVLAKARDLLLGARRPRRSKPTPRKPARRATPKARRAGRRGR
jgi:5-methyltetrahydropteroyltriglutamate--homocysteine methyltransferase